MKIVHLKCIKDCRRIKPDGELVHAALCGNKEQLCWFDTHLLDNTGYILEIDDNHVRLMDNKVTGMKKRFTIDATRDMNVKTGNHIQADYNNILQKAARIYIFNNEREDKRYGTISIMKDGTTIIMWENNNDENGFIDVYRGHMYVPM